MIDLDEAPAIDPVHLVLLPDEAPVAVAPTPPGPRWGDSSARAS